MHNNCSTSAEALLSWNRSRNVAIIQVLQSEHHSNAQNGQIRQSFYSSKEAKRATRKPRTGLDLSVHRPTDDTKDGQVADALQGSDGSSRTRGKATAGGFEGVEGPSDHRVRDEARSNGSQGRGRGGIKSSSLQTCTTRPTSSLPGRTTSNNSSRTYHTPPISLSPSTNPTRPTTLRRSYMNYRRC